MSPDRQEHLSSLQDQLRRQLARTRWLRRACLSTAVAETVLVSALWAAHVLAP
ncbi:MAG: hypothetical protein AAGK22_23740 [Acidobacteriota bacterium]